MWTTASVPHTPHLDLNRKTNQVYSTEASSSQAVVVPTTTPPVDSVLLGLRGSQVKQEQEQEQEERHLPPNLLTAGQNLELQRARSSAVSAAATESNDLPGADEHPILRLSDEVLRNTPFDRLMAPYGEADGGGSCSKDFGNELVNRWRDQRKKNCNPTNQGIGALHSSIDCFLVSQTRHHGNGDNLCLLENVAVDLKSFGQDSFTYPIIEEYVRTQHMRQPYPKFSTGFIKADCDPVKAEWRSEKMPGWNADLTVNALEILRGNEAAVKNAKAELCTVWIDHPVLFQQRDTFANFFHDSEDFVNVFLALAILQWTPAQTQIMLTDLYPEGPFWEMWSKVFSQGQPALTAWNIKEQFGKIDGHVCFKQLAIGIYGPAAPTTIASWNTPCQHTALVRAYSDFVIRSLNLQSHTHYAQRSPSKQLVVTFMSRRPTKQWPERKYCNDTHSFFLCRYWDKFGERSLGRMIRNDAEVISALKGLESESFPNGVTVKVQAVDYNVLTFEEQIKTDIGTDIMVGPHGAGLMHNIFMRDRAHLIELFVDGSAANRHFHNLASWYGRSYRGETMSNPIPTGQLLNMIRNAIVNIDSNSY
jgi:EGF domain-specific O-GlcNAc transferase